MTTPTYKGQGQPLASSGWLGGLGSWFGGVSTPAYAGKGQPSSGTSGYLAGSAPAYKPAPVKPSPAPASAAPAATAASTAPTGAATSPTPTDPASPTTAMTCPEDADPLDLPPFAIVIPRGVIEP